MGQAHLTACLDGEEDTPFCGDLNADHTVVHHSILCRKAVEAVPLDVLDRPEHLSVLGRHRLCALETERSAGGFPDDLVGVQRDRLCPSACRFAATVGFDHGQVDGDRVLIHGSSLHTLRAPEDQYHLCIVVRLSAVAAQPANGPRDHPPCGQTREALGALRPCHHVQADWPPGSPRPSPGEPAPGISLIRPDPPSGSQARLHRLVCWWGGPVQRSGGMTWQCPGPMSTTEATQFLCPRWTRPGALPPWCPAASPARRRRARRDSGRTGDTDRP
jgi:hypothetical protein